jgi:hypothetical protein
MRLLVVIILSLTLGLLSSLLVVVEPTWQDLSTTSVDWMVFSVNANPADESEFPDETPIMLFRVRVFGQSAPVPKVGRAPLRSVRTLPVRTQSYRSSQEELFRREAVLLI